MGVSVVKNSSVSLHGFSQSLLVQSTQALSSGELLEHLLGAQTKVAQSNHGVEPQIRHLAHKGFSPVSYTHLTLPTILRV